MSTDDASRSPPSGIRIFVSSTFHDMQAERDELVRRTFPRLRRKCESRGLTCTEIDLRWGITQSEADRGLVLSICLEEVERCRPFFIGLLGRRYGATVAEIPGALLERFPWLAGHAGASLTELEMLQGGLRDGAAPAEAFFYFRAPQAEPAQSAEETPEARQRLSSLRARVEASGRAREGAYRSPQELGEWILEDLGGVIDRLLPEEAEEPEQRERNAQRHFARVHSRMFVGREEPLELLSKHYLGDGPPLVVVGETGSGKSTLLAAWARLARGERVPALRLLPKAAAWLTGKLLGHDEVKTHAIVPRPDSLVHLGVGVSAGTSTASGFAHWLLRELRDVAGLPHPLREPAAALGAMPVWLEAAANRARICLLVDGLDRFSPADLGRFLAALPERWPPAMRLTLSSTPGPWVASARQRGWKVWELPEWPVATRREFVRTHLSAWRKTLEPAEEERLIRAKQTARVEFLRIILEELRLGAIFEGFEERVTEHLSAPDLPALYQQVLGRWERDLERHRRGVVGQALRLLWVARRGLSENELRHLLGQGDRLPDTIWSPLAICLETQITPTRGLYFLPPGDFRRAIEARYLPDTPRKLESHAALAAHFGAGPVSLRQVEELAWQLVASRGWAALAGILGHAVYLALAWKHAREDLLSAAVFLERFGNWKTSEIFAHMTHRAGSAAAAGGILLAQGEYENAWALLRQAEAEARERGEAAAAAEAASGLVLIERRTGRMPEALRHLEQLERAARERGDFSSLALHLGQHGEILRGQARLAEARRLHGEELSICLRLDDEEGVATAIGRLGSIDFEEGRYEAALAHFTEQEARCERLADAAGLAVALGNRAAALRRLDRHGEALALHRIEEKLLRRRGDRWALQVCLGNQAGIHEVLGDFDRAMQQLEEKEEICQHLGSPEALAKTWLQLSQLLAALSQRAQARRYAEKAETLAREHDSIALMSAIAKWRARLG